MNHRSRSTRTSGTIQKFIIDTCASFKKISEASRNLQLSIFQNSSFKFQVSGLILRVSYLNILKLEGCNVNYSRFPRKFESLLVININ